MSIAGLPMLREPALTLAAEELSAGLAIVGHPLAKSITLALARRVIRKYVQEERSEARPDKRISPMTLRLTHMKIGETESFTQAAPQIFRNRARSARRLMRNPHATWSFLALRGETFVTRLADGARPTRNPQLNSKAVFLASLLPEHGLVNSPLFAYRQALGTNIKITARKILNDPQADWSGITRRDRVYIRRTK